MILSGFLSALQKEDLEYALRLPTEQHGVAHNVYAILYLNEGMSYEEAASLLRLECA